MQYFIGLDLGTTTVKATVFDECGVEAGSAAVERILLTPKAGYCEQDALSWYTDSCKVIKEAVKDLDATKVKGISISSQGITTVAVDGELMPLYNAINWMDTRDCKSWGELVSSVGQEYFLSSTGNRVVPDAPKGIGKIMWIRDNEPEVYKRAKYFLMPASFVTAHLTGNVVTDPTMAAGTFAFSLKENDYDLKILAAAGIDADLLAPIKKTGSFAGKLLEKAALDCGLTTDCVVAVGGQDQKIAAYGVGLERNEIACSLGTSAALEFAVDGFSSHELPEMYKLCPYFDGALVLEAVIKTACGSVRWLRDTVCRGCDYRAMDEEASSSEIGANGVVFVPYLAGSPKNDKNASFNNLGLHNVRGDLIRAVYEGIGFEILRLISSVDIKPERIRVYSGGSRSATLLQIIADITGVEVVAYQLNEMGSLGAAKLAVGLVGAETAEFTRSAMENARVYVPAAHEEYSEPYELYLKFLKG